MIFSTICMAFAMSGAEPSKAELCDNYLKSIIETEKTGFISVAIEQNGKTLYEFADGTRQGNHKDFDKKTQLPVASITKIFTSVLLVRLMEEGKLSVYDNVRTFIPEFPFDDIMLLHLLTHTSGLRHTKGYSAAKRDEFYKSGLVRNAAVDTEFSYFSMGYDILADVIERISDKEIQDYAKQEIFDKIGMSDSAFSPNMGRAGMNTTAEDLLKFSRHILEIKKTRKAGILTPISVDLLFREYTNGRYDRSVAFFLKSQTRRFGRYFGDLNSPESAGHAGATGCFLLLDPTYDLSIVILTNGFRTFPTIDENFNRLNSLLIGQFTK